MSNNSPPAKPLKLGWLNARGEAGAREKKRTIIIPGGLPGEEVHWSELQRRGKTILGQLESVLSPSDYRQAPTCPWHSPCGGCDLAHLSSVGRAPILTAVAARALHFEGVVNWVASPRSSQHRARIKLSAQDGQVGYRMEKRHDLVPIEHCEIARPEVQQALQALQHQCIHSSIASIEIRSDGQRVALDIFTHRGHSLQQTDLPESFEHLSVNGKTVRGDPTLWLSVADLELRASTGVFYQVNLEINERLVAFILEEIRQLQPTRVLDLFSGIGNFGLPLAKQGIEIVGVEYPGRAIEDYKYTARRYGLSESIDIIALDAKKFDPSRVFFDMAVVDPPRIGTMGALAKLTQNRPTDIFYVSCHLPAAAKEIRDIAKAGYAIEQVRCFDMFPNTHHFETVIHLKRT